jgi:hypothetical protein
MQQTTCTSRGFHEAKLDAESVRKRLPDVERMILEAQEIARTKAHS